MSYSARLPRAEHPGATPPQVICSRCGHCTPLFILTRPGLHGLGCTACLCARYALLLFHALRVLRASGQALRTGYIRGAPGGAQGTSVQCWALLEKHTITCKRWHVGSYAAHIQAPKPAISKGKNAGTGLLSSSGGTRTHHSYSERHLPQAACDHRSQLPYS